MLDRATSLITVMLALSVSVERALTYLKMAVPALSSTESSGRPDHDRLRVAMVHGVAIVLSWACCALLFGEAHPLAAVTINGLRLPVWVVSLLGSGGSAFWNDLLGLTQALKSNARATSTAGRTGPTATDVLHVNRAGFAGGSQP